MVNIGGDIDGIELDEDDTITIGDEEFTEIIDVLETKTGGLSADGTEAEFETVISEDTPVVDVRSYGAVGDGETDDSAPIQNAADAASQDGGTLYIPPGVWLVEECIDISDETTVRFNGEMRLLDDGDDDHENAVLRVRGDNVTLLNPLLDADRETNWDNGIPGTQASLWVEDATNVTIVGGRIRNAIDTQFIVTDAEDISVYDLRGEVCGEHATYITDSKDITLEGTSFIECGKELSSNGYLIRNTERARVTGYIEYTGEEDTDTRGCRIDRGSRDVAIDVSAVRPQKGLWISSTNEHDINRDIRVSMSVYDAGDTFATALEDHDGLVIEDLYLENTTFSTREINRIESLTMRGGYLEIESDCWIGDADIRVDAQDDYSYCIAVEGDSKVEIDHAYLENGRDGASDSSTTISARDESRVVLRGGTFIGPPDGSGIVFVSDEQCIADGVTVKEHDNGPPEYGIRCWNSNDATLRDVNIESSTDDAVDPGVRTVENGRSIDSNEPGGSSSDWTGHEEQAQRRNILVENTGDDPSTLYWSDGDSWRQI